MLLLLLVHRKLLLLLRHSPLFSLSGLLLLL
jgi:hypothetical protein